MKKRVPAHLIHALLSILLAVGLTMPLLGVLLPSTPDPRVFLLIASVVLLFEIASLHRISALSVGVLSLLALLFWLFGAGGTVIMSDVLLAMNLRISGITTALPLVSEPVRFLVTVTVTLLSCLACLKKASCMPSLLLCVCDLLLIYLTDSVSLLPWLLPALGAALLMLLTDRFPETSVPRLIPWIAALLLACFALTGQGVTVEPLKEKADELRQSVLDHLFFTDPRDVFSLSTEGYYPEGSEQLGGKPTPRENPVMQVSTPRTAYLRGVILDEYTGRSWRNTTGGRRYLWQSQRFEQERIALFNQALPPEAVSGAFTQSLSVSVRMLTDSASTLFVPQRIRELIPGGDLVPYFSNASEVFITRNLQAGDTWRVSAPLTVAGDPGLGTFLDLCATLDDPGWETAVEQYISLPSHLEKPIYSLAASIASTGNTPYEKMMALVSYLSRGFRYTLDVDDQPANVDFVTRFLLDTKEGYCTYFASAMTVLCRMIGLPARYVEGYLAEPNEQGEALVTGLNGHAWTEVYFKGFGWLTVDATPRRRQGSTGNSSSGNSTDSTPSPEPEATPTPPQEQEQGEEQEQGGQDTPTPSPSNEPSPEPTVSDEPSASPSPQPPSPDTENSPSPESSPETSDDSVRDPGDFFASPLFWLLLLLLLLLLALAVRILRTSPAFRARRAATDLLRAGVWAQEIADLLHAERWKRKTGESLLAFTCRIDQSGPFTTSLQPVGECLSLICYARHVPGDAELTLLKDTATLLKGELSFPARLRYLARRIFLPLSRRRWTDQLPEGQ